jgi:hypothetical protein
MEAKAEKPQDKYDHKNCPKHGVSSFYLHERPMGPVCRRPADGMSSLEQNPSNSAHWMIVKGVRDKQVSHGSGAARR